MQAEVVIGANYGDEGKGLITDYLCHMSRRRLHHDLVVIRFSGGAQAGHTVVTPEGKRHVFSHFGSGSLQGVPTYLGPMFILNPILFREEQKRLLDLGRSPLVFADPRCIVTTPYDMIINQAVERSRGKNRHGSVGVGINETVERSQYPAFSLRMADLCVPLLLERKLYAIEKEWVPQRLAELGVCEEQQKVVMDFCKQDVLPRFKRDAEYFDRQVMAAPVDVLKRTTDLVVFEGAQGLMLDQTYGHWPYVTRANTGLMDVLPLASELGIQDMNVNYVTRSYLTRHGAGPMHHELPALPYRNVRDETNIPHDYQGALRFGYLDIDRLAEAVKYDGLHSNYTSIRLHRRMAVTCMDQIDQEENLIWSEGGTLHGIPDPEFFVQRIIKSTESVGGYVSYGPTRKDVSEFEP